MQGAAMVEQPESNMALLTHNELLSMPQTAALMRWIDSHDRPEATVYSTDDGTLTVCSALSDGTLIWEVIPNSLQAARDLLGY